MKKITYIFLLLPILIIAQAEAIIFETEWETDQWSLSGAGDDTWEYESDQGEPRTTGYLGSDPPRAISVGRDNVGRAVWFGAYNGHPKRNDNAKDDVARIDRETWVGFAMYINEKLPSSRVYAQFRNRVAPDDPLKGTGIAVKNPITLRQLGTGNKMKFDLLTNPIYAEVVDDDTGGASKNAVEWPEGGFDYTLNQWIDIVIHWTKLTYDGTGTIEIWVDGDLIINHTGVTNYRYHPVSGVEYSGFLKHTVGTYWATAGYQGQVYFDDYRIYEGATGTYEDVHPTGASPNGTPPSSTPVTSVSVVPTSDKMLVSDTRQLYETIVPSTASDLTGAWSSSNESVATVSSGGLVTAVGVGSCNITFTPTDQTNTPSDISAITVESSSTEDSIMILEPQGYYTPSSGDADSWDDTSGFELHGTEVGTITFTDEASFDGASYYDLPNSSFLNYLPTVDEWTVVYREGDTAPFGSGYALSKMDGTADTRQYGAMAYNDGIERFYAGGENEAVGVPLLDNNKLVIVIYETNQVNVWIDGENVISNSIAIGSNLAENSPNIGGRTDGSYLMNSGATLDIVATIPKAINPTEREAIETEFQVNGAPTNTSTTPSQINMNGQKTNEFFINGVKYKVTPN